MKALTYGLVMVTEHKSLPPVPVWVDKVLFEDLAVYVAVTVQPKD